MVPDDRLVHPGPLNGLLFGSPRRFVGDLAMMLRVCASFEDLRAAADRGGKTDDALVEFVAAAKAWQHQHGYENSWSSPGFDEALRKLNSSEVNAVLDSRFNPFAVPKLTPGETPFEYVAQTARRGIVHAAFA